MIVFHASFLMMSRVKIGSLFDSPDTRIIGKTQHFATSLTFGAGESSKGISKDTFRLLRFFLRCWNSAFRNAKNLMNHINDYLEVKMCCASSLLFQCFFFQVFISLLFCVFGSQEKSDRN